MGSIVKAHNPSQAAINLYWIYGARTSSEARDNLEVMNERYSSALSIQAEFHRFRDWNPDAKVASRQGVTLRYISRQNTISAPEMSYQPSHLQTGNRVAQGDHRLLLCLKLVPAADPGGKRFSSPAVLPLRQPAPHLPAPGPAEGSGGRKEKIITEPF